MYTRSHMFKFPSLSGMFMPFAARGEPGRKRERRALSEMGRREAPLPWKFALPLIVALSLVLWAVIIVAAERLLSAII
jgi:hypothetical protein